MMGSMKDAKPESDIPAGPALHHHCCHHHTADPHLCHQRGASSSHPSFQDIYFRPDAGEGLWLPALLPLACISVCAVVGTASNLPLALLAIQSCICCYHLQRSCFSRHSQLMKESCYAKSSKIESSNADSARSPSSRCVVLRPLPQSQTPSSQVVLVCSAVTAALLWLAAGAGVVVSVTAVVVNVAVVRVVCEWLMSHHSRTFSVGEWLFAGECAGVCVSYSMYGLLCGCPASSPCTHCQMDAFLQLSVMVSGLLLLLVLLLPSHSRSLLVLIPLVGVVGMVGVIWSSLLLGEFSPIWLLNEFIGKQPNSGLRRPLLLCWWGSCSVVAWLTTSWVYRYRAVPVPVVRKVYHVIAVAVCVAGVAVDASFLRLASVAASIACLIMEVVRVLDVPLVSPVLTSAFSNFLDEKDRSGKLILSPVYLLVGLGLPLWLLPLPIPYCLPCPHASSNFQSGGPTSDFDPSRISDSDFSEFIRPTKIALLQLAGVLAVGIGDTFASIGGTRYGKHKYPGTKKSLEGTVCGVGTQLVVVVVLVVCGMVEVGHGAVVWWWGVFLTVLVASMVEAFTNQVDNLALPLLTFVGFCWTEYLSSA